jgi:hypothetical protein
VVDVTDRGRVPFAVVGVLLLVGSATVATVDAPRSPAEPATERAIEDARSATQTALRTAARRAARDAARNPVLEPANTTVGRALGEHPFRRSLALRAHLAFASHAERIVARDGDVTARVEVPRVRNESGLRAALDRTTVERAGANGTATRVGIEKVTVVAERNGRVVERVELSPSVVLGSPVLFVHDRVRTFDDRLDRGPMESGLARRTTARLYALAWARGYAQYGGAPVSNVVSNRHATVAVNHALLAEQRHAFGRVDAAGRRGVRVAATRTLATDALTVVGDRTAGEATAIIDATDAVVGSGADDLQPVRGGDAPAPESTIRVGVDASADRAFLALQDDLDGLLRSVYTARVRLQADVERVDQTQRGVRRPAGDWTLVSRRRETTRTATSSSVDPPTPGEAWHVLRPAGRRVVERAVTTSRWRRGNRTTTTRQVTLTTYRVGLAVVGRHAPSDHAPRRGIDGVHRRGDGRLDGPNLAGVEAAAVERLVAERGGADALAERAVDGRLDTDPVVVAGDRPAALRGWVYRDLVALRERVRNTSVAVRRGSLGTYATNPAARLADRLRERRAALVDAPDSYAGVADKARVAARAAYLDRVIAAMDERADRTDGAGGRFQRALLERGVSPSQLRAAMWQRRARLPERRRFVSVGGRFELAPDGAPPYLTRATLDRRRIDAGEGYEGLAARNTNLFTAPYGDAADDVVGALFGEKSARLRTAARTLQAAEHAPANSTAEALRSRRDRLRTHVRREIDDIRRRARVTLRRRGIGDSRADRRTIVEAGLSRWPTPADRALAFANGSAADAIWRAAVDRQPSRFDGSRSRDRLRVALRGTVRRGVAVAEVPRPVVNDTAVELRRWGRPVVRAAAKNAVEAGVNATTERARQRLERRMGRSLARVPAGLPVTPVPAHWYATTNVWDVELRAEYSRFTVRADRGPPGDTLAYTRDGRTVRLDWDGDGTRERLGRASRVDLHVRTGVVVVVPPGGQGVGDVDGNADERSDAWSESRSVSARSPPGNSTGDPTTGIGRGT